jgi:DNA-binding winged helix-turn-helix (wHTH) protein
MPLRFADCEFDAEARELRREGVPQPLHPKAMRLLELLLDARPRALSRQELHDGLWPKTYVGATSLARIVNALRAAVGDDRRGQAVVRTVHGYGYAFAAEVTVVEPATGSLLWSGHVIPLPSGRCLLGRAPDCGVRVPAPGVSRHHARIRSEGGRTLIEDLESKNGTFVAGRRVEAPTALADGDEIRLGEAVLVYCAPGAGESTETTGGPARKR